ncbi:MAG: hypothetical protein SVP52_03950 [Chloroflexota bacterium]|nr:hypothetical protein [Chloroflexota bacterium]
MAASIMIGWASQENEVNGGNGVLVGLGQAVGLRMLVDVVVCVLVEGTMKVGLWAVSGRVSLDICDCSITVQAASKVRKVTPSVENMLKKPVLNALLFIKKKSFQLNYSIIGPKS